jgi:hypothetical protein
MARVQVSGRALTPHRNSLRIPGNAVDLRLTAAQARTVAELAENEHDVVVTRIRRHDDVSVVLPSEASRYAVSPDGMLAREKSEPSYRKAR